MAHVATVATALLLVACQPSKEEAIGNVYALTKDGSPESLERVRTLTGSEDPDVRATAIFELARLEVDDAATFARAGLDDADSFVRATSAHVLGDVGQPSDVPALARRLAEDPHKVVRQRAAESLAELGGDAAVAALVDALEDPMDSVRAAAIKGVTALDPSAGVAPLSRLLLEDPEWEIRSQAARALGATGDPAVIAFLDLALDDSSEMVRAAAAAARRSIEVEERSGSDG